MGSSLLPVIADLVLQDLESKTLSKQRYVPPLCYRYIGDIVMAALSDFFKAMIEIFNFYSDQLQFIEESNDNILNFLDIKMIVKNNRLVFDRYNKSTSFGNLNTSTFVRNIRSYKRKV